MLTGSSVVTAVVRARPLAWELLHDMGTVKKKKKKKSDSAIAGGDTTTGVTFLKRMTF